jgi:hypothetical protein
MAQYIRASLWVRERLFKPASNLLASITQAYRSAANLYLLNLLRVPIGSNTNRFRVSLTTAGQLIKAALTSAKASLIQIGSLLLTTVRQTKQAAPTAPLRKKGKPAGKTKSAQSRSKGSKTAQTPTAHQLTQDGLKSQGLAKQRRQRAKQQLKAKA